MLFICFFCPWFGGFDTVFNPFIFQPLFQVQLEAKQKMFKIRWLHRHGCTTILHTKSDFVFFKTVEWCFTITVLSSFEVNDNIGNLIGSDKWAVTRILALPCVIWRDHTKLQPYWSQASSQSFPCYTHFIFYWLIWIQAYSAPSNNWDDRGSEYLDFV